MPARLADLGEARAAGLLGRLARGRAPLGQRLRGPVAAPDADAPLRGPRHDHVGPDLGEHLDRELGPVALGDGLDDRHVRLLGALPTTSSTTAVARLAGRGDRTGRGRAGAVGQHDLLADPDPPHGDRVLALGAVEARRSRRTPAAGRACRK